MYAYVEKKEKCKKNTSPPFRLRQIPQVTISAYITQKRFFKFFYLLNIWPHFTFP